jgi:hypothetical protein
MLQSLESVIRKVIQSNVASDCYEAIIVLGFGSRIIDLLMYPSSYKLAILFAECPSTPSYLLEELARHSNSDVRQAVAESRRTPVTALWNLARDEDADVRYVLAECSHISTDILEALSKDENPYVSTRAIKTLNCIARASGTNEEPQSHSVNCELKLMSVSRDSRRKRKLA